MFQRLLFTCLIVGVGSANVTAQSREPREEWSKELKDKWALLDRKKQNQILFMYRTLDVAEPSAATFNRLATPEFGGLVYDHWDFFCEGRPRASVIAAGEFHGGKEFVELLGFNNKSKINIERLKIDFALLARFGITKQDQLPQKAAISAAKKVRAKDLSRLTDQEKRLIRLKQDWYKSLMEIPDGQ